MNGFKMLNLPDETRAYKNKQDKCFVSVAFCVLSSPLVSTLLPPTVSALYCLHEISKGLFFFSLCPLTRSSSVKGDKITSWYVFYQLRQSYTSQCQWPNQHCLFYQPSGFNSSLIYFSSNWWIILDARPVSWHCKWDICSRVDSSVHHLPIWLTFKIYQIS